MQFGDGLRGALIVRDPKDPYKGAYDEEVVVLLTDPIDIPGNEELEELEKNGMGMAMGDNACTGIWEQDWSDQTFYTLLTNGKGWVKDDQGMAVGEPEIIRVQHGKRYRLRIISGVASWGIKINITGHTFDVIQISGGYVQVGNPGNPMTNLVAICCRLLLDLSSYSDLMKLASYDASL
jgi:FtsP/CotA-like multicopper oxidase with cupredoxin domain